tara:strand:- start:269 stop:1546 length:1278 start_codon:yes stop_codon:yes gene_type:complete
MIVNLFLKNKIFYNDIEYILNVLLTTISSIVCINCIYDSYYKETVQMLSIYLFIELFFLPVKKIDTIIHHFFTLSNCYYVLFLHPIDLTNNFYSTKTLLLTETSSIFLGLSEIFKNTIFGNISKALFVLLFFKTRIYDYIYNILLSQYFYDSLGSHHFLRNWQYMCTYGLFSLQLYWACIILKIISKQFLKNLPISFSEYILQYTYFLSFLTTAISYSYLLGNNENKIIYGTYSLLDVASNGLVCISSYYFHQNIYFNINKPNYTIINYKHEKKLLFDLFSIDIRILAQFFANIYMHNLELHQRYFHFSLLIFLFVFELSLIDTIYYHYIENKRQKYFSDNVNNLLNLIQGFPPLIGILLSSYNIPDNSIFLNTAMQVYLIILFFIIKPFYDYTLIGVHLLMCLVNYQLVINNTYFIRNELEIIE